MSEVAPPQSSSWKTILSLYLAMMAVGTGQTVVFAVLPMLGREMSLHTLTFTLPFTGLVIRPGEMAITSLSALTALVFFLFAPLWGRISDRRGRKPIIIVGLTGYALGTLLFNGVAYLGLVGALGGASLYILLIVTRAAHAALMSAAHPASSAYMVEITPVHERTKGMARLQAFNQLGSMVGPALAWFVNISFLAPLYIQATLMAVLALLVHRTLPALPVTKPKDGVASKLSFFDRRFRFYLFVGFTVFSMLGMVQQTLGFYFQDLLNLDSVKAAQLFSYSMVVSAAAMLVAQFVIVQRFNGPPETLLKAGLPFGLVGYLILANAASLPLLLAGMSLFGFGMGLTAPSYFAAASLTVDAHEQGGLAGLIGAAAGLGFVTGPLVGGFLYQLSPSYPYWCAAATMSILIVVVYLHRRPIAGSE
ncbi:MFS transporter [Spongiibacter nanhainus]|uniref:MFS transporter n=1 Tax=Spongiibacter nanhainus TaxID=2794344 RepID=A0A7T4R3I5_9GAMM|nr:MFS transporter [Spongiibacter nanhainus]QQD19811.1 MFS transporter [Spongiibacter nanhainus]